MLITLLLLSGYSLIVLFTITPDLFWSQIVATVCGIILYTCVRLVDKRVFQNLWIFWYLFGILLLIISFFGPEVRGAHRWIEIGSQRIQPSEIVKPFMIVVFAAYLTGRKKYIASTFASISTIFVVPFMLIFRQPDLGNSIVYFVVFMTMITISKFNIKYLIVPIIIGLLLTPLAWHFLADYQKMRIVTFANPDYDIQGAGYNARQSLIAIGSGGLFGKGLGHGTQSKLQFLPEFHTDFIFASTVEQLGFIGGAVLLVLYTLLLYQIICIGRSASEYQKLLTYGFCSQIFIQVFINIGMNLALLPITGITLPLFSFGGSSVIASYLGFGLLDVWHHTRKGTIAIK